MNESTKPRLAVDDVDALISDLEVEYSQVRAFGINAMPVTNNCTHNTVTLSECCKTF